MDELKHLLILDFEANATDKNEFPREEMEIIEFPILVFDIKNKIVIDTFHMYVKPKIHPILTDFCKNLTKIEQSTVEAANDFETVLNEAEKFISKYEHNSIFLTCGDWDLKIALFNQLSLINFQASDKFKKWINIKKEYKTFYKLKKQPVGMHTMLEDLNLELKGTHHSGIDDCKNIAQIIVRMINDGHKFTI